MNNLDIRIKIKENRLCHYEVAAKIGVSEYALSLMLKSDNPPPHITINKKVMINYPLFIEWLDNESKKAVSN